MTPQRIPDSSATPKGPATSRPARKPNALHLTRNLIRKAREYAEMGRDYPTYGAGSLLDDLNILQDVLRKDASAKATRNRTNDRRNRQTRAVTPAGK